jgi:hypothetical protein
LAAALTLGSLLVMAPGASASSSSTQSCSVSRAYLPVAGEFAVSCETPPITCPAGSICEIDSQFSGTGVSTAGTMSMYDRVMQPLPALGPPFSSGSCTGTISCSGNTPSVELRPTAATPITSLCSADIVPGFYNVQCQTTVTFK